MLSGWTKGQNASNKLRLMCFTTSRKRADHRRLLESHHRTGHICSNMEAHNAPGVKPAGMVSRVMCLCLKFREIPSECFCNGPRKQNTMRRKHVKWEEAGQRHSPRDIWKINTMDGSVPGKVTNSLPPHPSHLAPPLSPTQLPGLPLQF